MADINSLLANPAQMDYGARVEQLRVQQAKLVEPALSARRQRAAVAVERLALTERAARAVLAHCTTEGQAEPGGITGARAAAAVERAPMAWADPVGTGTPAWRAELVTEATRRQYPAEPGGATARLVTGRALVAAAHLAVMRAERMVAAVAERMVAAATMLVGLARHLAHQVW